MKTLVLTGATGFIGRHLVRQLKKHYQLIALVRSVPKDSLFEGVRCELVGGPWQQQVQGAIEGAIHLAVEYGRSTATIENIEAVNVRLPLQLAELAVDRGARILITTDSFFQKYPAECPYLKEYRASKARLRALLQPFTFSLTVVNAVLEHVIGSGDRADKFVPQLLQKLRRPDPTIELTPADQERDFVHVSDVVGAFETLLLKSPQQEGHVLEVSVGTGTSHSLREFCLRARELTKSSSELNFGALPHRDNELMISKADTSFLRSLGWKPRMSLQQSIQECL